VHVLPDLWPAVRLFLAAEGQWRERPVPGLDLAALDVAARWLNLAPSPALLNRVRVIEGAVLDTWRRQADR
jgi:hypothetical protein